MVAAGLRRGFPAMLALVEPVSSADCPLAARRMVCLLIILVRTSLAKAPEHTPTCPLDVAIKGYAEHIATAHVHEGIDSKHRQRERREEEGGQHELVQIYFCG